MFSFRLFSGWLEKWLLLLIGLPQMLPIWLINHWIRKHIYIIFGEHSIIRKRGATFTMNNRKQWIVLMIINLLKRKENHWKFGDLGIILNFFIECTQNLIPYKIDEVEYFFLLRMILFWHIKCFETVLVQNLTFNAFASDKPVAKRMKRSVQKFV